MSRRKLHLLLLPFVLLSVLSLSFSSPFPSFISILTHSLPLLFFGSHLQSSALTFSLRSFFQFAWFVFLPVPLGPSPFFFAFGSFFSSILHAKTEELRMREHFKLHSTHKGTDPEAETEEPSASFETRLASKLISDKLCSMTMRSTDRVISVHELRDDGIE